MRLQGTHGSKKTLHSNESRASCVELRDMHLSMDQKTLSDLASLFLDGMVDSAIIMGGLSFGGGIWRDVSIKTVASPVTNSSSRPSEAQNWARISKARDESGETSSMSLLEQRIWCQQR